MKLEKKERLFKIWKNKIKGGVPKIYPLCKQGIFFIFKMGKKINLILMIVFVLVINFATTTPDVVLAADDDDEESLNLDEPSEKGDFKNGGKSYYNLDIVPNNADDEDYFEDGESDRGFFGFLKINDMFEEKVVTTVNYFANVGLNFNIFLTELMISALDIAYEFSFVNVLIDEISEIMKDITGISGGGFSSNGIFGELAIFTAILTVVYAVFLLIFKRSMFQSLSTILQTIVCLTIAILLFTNYSSFMKGINDVTTEMSSLVLGSSITSQEDEEGEEDEEDDNYYANPNTEQPSGLDEADLRGKMSDNLWSLFVDRPYLYMMYGKTRLDDDLTTDRVNKLLKTKVDSAERLEALEEEFERDNEYITYSNVMTRISFTPIYLLINGITSILVYGLALFLILFQFWFMMIAVFAPFALLIGAIPGMFGVTKRYFIELGLPLALKIVVSFGALIVFTISEVLYKMDFYLGEMGQSVNTTFGFYMTVVAVHWVLLGLLFFLRKRIANIFVNSNAFMREMRGGMGTVTDPLKSGVKGATSAVGAGVGAFFGGPAGALAGAGLGSKVGETATGDANVGELAQQAGRTAMYSQFSKSKTGDSNNAGTNANTKTGTNYVNTQQPQTSNNNTQDTEEKQAELEEQGKESLNNYLDGYGMDEKQKEEYANEMELQDVDMSKVNNETIDRNFDKENISSPMNLAKDIKKGQTEEANKIESIKTKRRESFNSFLGSKDLSQNEIKQINSNLANEDIDVAHVRKDDYEQVNSMIQSRIENGEDLNYVDEMSQELSNRYYSRMGSKDLDTLDRDNSKVEASEDLYDGSTYIEYEEPPPPPEEYENFYV